MPKGHCIFLDKNYLYLCAKEEQPTHTSPSLCSEPCWLQLPLLDQFRVLLFNDTFSYHKAECLSNKVQKQKAWALGVIRHTQFSSQVPLLLTCYWGSRSPGAPTSRAAARISAIQAPCAAMDTQRGKPNLPLRLRGKAGGGARVTAGPKRPHLGVCAGPNFPLHKRIANKLKI